jgi:chemotaxis protein histidine kinase CheA
MSSVKSIFDKSVKNGKIKNGMLPKAIISMIVKEYKKPLTSSQEEEVRNYIQQYAIKTVFDENKDDFDDFDDIKREFVENRIVRKENKSDLKYLEELFNDYKVSEDVGNLELEDEEEDEDVKEVAREIERLKLENDKKKDKERKKREEERKKEEDKKEKERAKEQKKLEEERKKDEEKREKEKKKMEKENKDKNKRAKEEEEDYEKAPGFEEEELEKREILNEYDVQDLQNLIKRYITDNEKKQFNEKNKDKKPYLITFIVNIMELSNERIEKFVNEQDLIRKSEIEEEEEEKELYDELKKELNKYTKEELVDIIEHNRIGKRELKANEIGNKQKLIGYFLEYIGPDYELPPKKKELKCSIDNPKCNDDQSCNLDTGICVPRTTGKKVGQYYVVGKPENLKALSDKLGIRPIQLPENVSVKPGQKLPIEEKKGPKIQLPPLEEKGEKLPQPDELYAQLQAIKQKEVEGSSKIKEDLSELQKQIAICLGVS